MSCCFNLPLAASTFWQRAWRHGHLLCQLFPLLRYGLLAVSLFTVLAITINRYVMIGHPTLYPKLYHQQYLGLMVGCTWVSGFGALVATWFGRWGRFGLDPIIGSCSILPDAQGHSPKEFLFIVAFVIPCICIVVCYARIFYIVRKTALKSRVNATRNNTMSTCSSTAVTSTNKSSYYSVGKMRLLKKYHNSTEDSALGSSSTGPSYSTEKSSTFLDNGTSSEMSHDHLTIKMVTLNPPAPHLLSPSNTSPVRFHKTVLADPSSSSGVEGLGEDDEPVSRSVTPTSLCSSSHATSPTISSKRSINRKRYHKERIPSAVNSTLSHIGAVFRRSSHLTKSSPRRPSSMIPAMPGRALE
ncbi:uncharacterized protein LOC142331256 isoform X2 [Lycorma delicatula]|uniref:uncharacterized protein LOC142331256 isoform X2 n=1 Tax=Lycorma delicatula TaxID=130591 RepID=UPI003F511EF1